MLHENTTLLDTLACLAEKTYDIDQLFSAAETKTISQVQKTEVWSHCAANCPGKCPLYIQLNDGEIASVQPYSDARACLRGRSMRYWVNSPDRLRFPMRRVGKRGSADFERISWDEALDEIAAQLQRVIKQYGNDAIYIAYATGQNCTTDQPFKRLMTCLGGYLGSYNNYSNAQITAMTHIMEGTTDNAVGGSDLCAAAEASLVLAFGATPTETAQGGGTTSYEWLAMRKKVEARGGRVLVIDPRLNTSLLGRSDDWIPIKPGTDAALATALCHEVYVRGVHDEAFLMNSCVGFYDETLPESYQKQGLSYLDYLMGTGYDGVEKTLSWAAEITEIPLKRLEWLADLVVSSKPLFVMQGWGPQRRMNGEMLSGSIMMLPLVTGQVGLPGTNNGVHENLGGHRLSHLPKYENPVKPRIPSYLFTDAIDHGHTMTAEHDGVLGADVLRSDIKLIINHAGNCLTNQHGNINRAHGILADESKCEFILGIDVEFSDSARYADILLPDLFRIEQDSLIDSGAPNRYITAGSAAVSARFERRSAWDMCCDIAERLGVKDQFTEGLSQEGWIRRLYEKDRVADPSLPEYDSLKKQGVWYQPCEEPKIALRNFREDPVQNPLNTPSGKIEIFSEQLFLHRGMKQNVYAVPGYIPEWEGLEQGDFFVCEEEGQKTYPLQLTGFHTISRIHSSWGNVSSLIEENPHMLWMNPVDAQVRDIKQGDVVCVENSQGSIVVPVYVTNRIMQGVVALPQGTWHQAEMEQSDANKAGMEAADVEYPDAKHSDRTDFGGCINTLTISEASPITAGNPQNTIQCEVRLVGNVGASEQTGEALVGEPRSSAGKSCFIAENLSICTGQTAATESMNTKAKTEVASLCAVQESKPSNVFGATKVSGASCAYGLTPGVTSQKAFPKATISTDCLSVFLDSSLCTNCKTCLTACRDYRHVPLGVAVPKMLKAKANVACDQESFLAIPFGCAHCKKPQCIPKCPAGAIFKDEVAGLVLVKREICRGCGACAIGCPYHAPELDMVHRKMLKCDGCYDRVIAGQLPICVEACPTRALQVRS